MTEYTELNYIPPDTPPPEWAMEEAARLLGEWQDCAWPLDMKLAFALHAERRKEREACARLVESMADMRLSADIATDIRNQR